MQQECRVGTSLYGMWRTMGVPSPISHAKKVVCVGGGLGVAPIFPQARGFKEGGAYVIGVLGFRNKDFWFSGKTSSGPAAMNLSCAPTTAQPA